jgi:hypothetical protein
MDRSPIQYSSIITTITALGPTILVVIFLAVLYLFVRFNYPKVITLNIFKENQTNWYHYDIKKINNSYPAIYIN